MITGRQTLPRKLKMLRKSNGYSQEDVGKVLNISRQGYQHYESGRREPSKESLMKLSQLYNVPLIDLISDKVEIRREDLVGESPVYSKTSIMLEERMMKRFRKLSQEQKRKAIQYVEMLLNRRM